MPEGDTIYQTAVRLRVFAGQRIVAADAPRDPLDLSALDDGRLLSVESRGKHLLMPIGKCVARASDVNGDDSTQETAVVHSHMGMTGSWLVRSANESFPKPRTAAALILAFESNGIAACFTPATLEILRPADVQRHEVLRHLGADLLAEEFDLPSVVSRLRALQGHTVGEALLKQTAVCGIGNVYKSEILFLSQTSPFTRVSALSVEKLEQILQIARELLVRNRLNVRRRTRWGRDGPALWVYRRQSDRCLKCGETICMRRQGDLGRSTYWCPRCQPESTKT